MIGMLKVKKLEGGYQDFKVLQCLNFKVEKGSITCLLGPNGSGKTTTLYTLMGILRPWSGVIDFDGVNIAGKKTHEIVKLGISLVPEGRRVFGDMTVYENLEMGMYIKEKREKFNDNLEVVFNLFPILKQRRKQKAKTLSGGEQQMLAIARSLVSAPKLLLMDEPSMGLAPKLAQEVLNVTKQLQENDITILLVEQNIYLAKRVMQYAYVLEGGVIVAQGTYEELVDNPTVKKAYLGIS